MLAKVRQWLLTNSSSLRPLSLVSPIPNLPNVPAQFSYASGPTLAFQSPCMMRIYFLETSVMVDSKSSQPLNEYLTGEGASRKSERVLLLEGALEAH